MSADLQLVDLGGGALDFLRRVLLQGGPISRAVAGRVGPGSTVRTWAEKGTDAALLDAHVSEGGLIVPSARPLQGGLVPIENPSRDLMVHFVARKLQEPQTLLVIDDGFLRRSDLRGGYPEAHVCEDDRVVHLLGSGSSRDRVEALLQRIPSWEWCGILANVPQGWSHLDAAGIAETASALFCPAFDHEGWLVLEAFC